MAVKKFDLVIYGASSFVGQILTEYLYEHIGLTRKVKWAIAGRSEAKLTELRSSLGEGAAKLPIIIGKKKYVIIYLRYSAKDQSGTVFKLAAEQFSICYAAGVARKLSTRTLI